MRHPITEHPEVCGECRVFNITGLHAYQRYMKGEDIEGECRRSAPCMSRYLPMFPTVSSGDIACGDALGTLPGVTSGPIA